MASGKHCRAFPWQSSRARFFAFLGPNGSGKTTLFRLLSTLIPLQSGVIKILGSDVLRDTTQVRRQIGVVFQAPSLDKKLTAAENLWHQGHLYGLSGRELKDRCSEMLERLGVADRARDRVETLSGGLRRRVELAKGLLHRPRVLLLDEPSTGLDPAARSDLWHYLSGLARNAGVTIALTTHLLDEAEKADRLAILHAGKIVACDTPAALRATVGGDSITLTSPAPRELADAIRHKFALPAEVIGGDVRLQTADAGPLGGDARGSIRRPNSNRDVGQAEFGRCVHRPHRGIVFGMPPHRMRHREHSWPRPCNHRRRRRKPWPVPRRGPGWWWQRFAFASGSDSSASQTGCLVRSGNRSCFGWSLRRAWGRHSGRLVRMLKHRNFSYGEFFFPGTLALILLFTAIFTTISIIEDRREGFLQSVLVAPVPRWAMVLGKVLGGALIALAQAVLFLLLAWTVGIRLGPLAVLAVIGWMFVLALALTALGSMFAWSTDSTQGFHAVMSVILFPMWLLSGSFFPVDSGWLAWIVRLNPLTYGVAGLRRLLYLDVADPRLPPGVPSLMTCTLVTFTFFIVTFGLAWRAAGRRNSGRFAMKRGVFAIWGLMFLALAGVYYWRTQTRPVSYGAGGGRDAGGCFGLA